MLLFKTLINNKLNQDSQKIAKSSKKYYKFMDKMSESMTDWSFHF